MMKIFNLIARICRKHPYKHIFLSEYLQKSFTIPSNRDFDDKMIMPRFCEVDISLL